MIVDSFSLPEDTTPPEIEFRNVSFHYTEAKPVLENINFVIKSGTVTAVVGEDAAPLPSAELHAASSSAPAITVASRDRVKHEAMT